MVCELYLNNAVFKRGKTEQKVVWAAATATSSKVTQQKWLRVLRENKAPESSQEGRGTGRL